MRKALRASTSKSTKHTVLAIAGRCRWLRELLLACLSHRNRKDWMDLGSDDADLPDRVAKRRPGVLILDMPSPRLTRLAFQIHRTCPSTRIIAFTGSELDFDLVHLVKAGISGVVPADSGLLEARREVAYAIQGEGACSPRMTDALVRHIEEGREAAGGGRSGRGDLSPRERQIVDLVSQNLPNKAIADRLGISEGTVKNHVHRILRKTTAQNRSQLVGEPRVANLQESETGRAEPK